MMNHKKKKRMLFAAALAALLLIAGTWAFYSASSTINNELQTGDYGSRTSEEFTPKETLEPGSQVTKNVGVENTGDYNLVVRIRMEEKWERNGNIVIFHKSDSSKFNSVTASTAGGVTSYTATQPPATAPAGGDAGEADGLVPTDVTAADMAKASSARSTSYQNGDDSVMYKTLNTTDWTYNAADGYWYYNQQLAPGASTGSLLSSLVLASNTDMGKYSTTAYYSTASKTSITGAKNTLAAAEAALAANPTDPTLQAAVDSAKAALETAYNWSTTKPADEKTINFIKSENALASGNEGYADADYTLSIITDVCQATSDAVQTTWAAEWANIPAAVKTGWNL